MESESVLQSNLDSSVEPSLIKEKAIQEFKKTYSGGYLGYNLIYNLGDVTNLVSVDDKNHIENYKKKLRSSN